MIMINTRPMDNLGIRLIMTITMMIMMLGLLKPIKRKEREIKRRRSKEKI